MKQYVQYKFNNPRDIIIVVRYLKDTYAHIDMNNFIHISKDDKEYIILITQLQEEAKDCLKIMQVINNNVQKSMVFYGDDLLMLCIMNSKGAHIIIKIQTILIAFC